MAKKKTILLPNDSARNIAVNCLNLFARENKLIQESLDTALSQVSLDPRDCTLAGELALGACRMLITLDHIIEKHSNRSMRQIDPVILQILRVALYQLLYLDRTPDFAVTHQAVEQARQTKITGADNFVNALLRSIQRDMVDNPKYFPEKAILPLSDGTQVIFKKDFLPEKKRTPDKYLSLVWSHPRWLTDRWIKKFGLETTERICRTNNIRPTITLRPNRLKTSSEELLAKLKADNIPALRLGLAIHLLVRINPVNLPGFFRRPVLYSGFNGHASGSYFKTSAGG